MIGTLLWLMFVMTVEVSTPALSGIPMIELISEPPAIQPVPHVAVRLDGGFWGPIIERNRSVTIPAVLDQCDATGRTRNFLRAAGKDSTPFQGAPYDDSDVYKAMEGGFLSLAVHPDAALESRLDHLIADIAAAQESDGYLYTIAICRHFPASERWIHEIGSHELYDLGHLYEAAVAHHQATGKTTLLDVATKSADMLVATFGPDGHREPPGHPEIELALVKLAEETKRPQYAELARFFLHERGNASGHKLYGIDLQDHIPLSQQREAIGHSVRAAYLYSGAADVARACGDHTFDVTLETIWNDMVTHRMHLTGGIGAQASNEGFGAPYELPNDTAYLETCAAIANALWAQRMYQRTGETGPLDVVERIIFNGFLAGVSFKGDEFFYPNPLGADGVRPFNHGSRGRVPWFACACCPPNVARFVAQLPGFMYATRPGRIDVCQYGEGTATIPLADGAVILEQATGYPWAGEVRLKADWPTEKSERRRFKLALRVPGWSRAQPVPSDLYQEFDRQAVRPTAGDATITVNGAPIQAERESGWLVIDREWRRGDTATLSLPMDVHRVVAHHKVEADRGRVAVERGPLVYCIEGIDQRDASGEPIDFQSIFLPDNADLEAQPRADLIGSPVAIAMDGMRLERSAAAGSTPVAKPCKLTAIPYFLWANRGAGPMEVWIPRSERVAKVPEPPTLAGSATVTASHCWGSDTPEAVHDRRRPATPADQGIARHTWWPHKGSSEWLEYRWSKPVTLKSVRIWWFDDTKAGGGCALPASWELLSRDGDSWMPIRATFAPPGPNGMSAVTFDPVTTTGLRLQVNLAPEKSAGVLEWEVE